jgi:hypothetical protein
MVLLQIGMGLNLTNWIMSCVVSTSYSILINGEATDFFKSGRGIRQGFPLSPLLFILVMEGLSLLLKDNQSKGKLSGIKVSRTIKILHILFVDDVVIMTTTNMQEWWEIDKVLNVFVCPRAYLSMEQSPPFIKLELSDLDLLPFKAIFPYNFLELD